LRNKRLDVLRAIAILLVLFRHADGPTILKNVGWTGVDLFFVLSGFLISGILFTEYKRTGGISWGRFFIRRGFKIYPAFYAMIFVTFLWRIAQHRENQLAAYAPELFFYQSYQSNRMWAHTWSLAVEEHFYILLAGLLLLMLCYLKKGRQDPFWMVPAVWVILAFSCLLQRVYMAHTMLPTDDLQQKIMFPTHLRIDSLFFGVFLGYLHHFHGEILRRVTTGWFRVLLFAVSVMLLSTCFVFQVKSPFMLGCGLTAVYLGFGGVLLLTLYGFRRESGESWLRKLRVGDLAAYVGMHSYSIYLWHGVVAQHDQGFMRMLWPKIGETAILWGYILLSLAAGIVLSRLIEFPALRVRDRLFPNASTKSMLITDRRVVNPEMQT
jgi:peptidoglycan/LPS O-acetylase OafA/YrhL